MNFFSSYRQEEPGYSDYSECLTATGFKIPAAPSYLGEGLGRMHDYLGHPSSNRRNKQAMSLLQIVKLGSCLTASVLTCGWIIYRYMRHNRSPIGSPYFSRYVGWRISRTAQPKYAAATIRKAFLTSATIYYPALPRSNNHSHPEACVERNQASLQSLTIVRELGMAPYYVQQSTADVKKGLDGCRSYHWAKDVSVAPSTFNPPSDACVVMVDVDMYLDMPRTLAMYPRTYLISTFQPEAVAATSGNYNFTFNEENEVVYHVSGGATYQHRVWNYSADVLVASTASDPLGLGLSYRLTVYAVERRQTSDHHQLILLVPIKTLTSPLLDMSKWLGGYVLERLSPVVKLRSGLLSGNFLRLSVVTQEGMMRSTGKCGEYAVATITTKQDDTIAGQARITNVQLTPHQVKTILSDVNDEAATILTEYHRFKAGPPLNYVYPMAESVYRMQFDPKTYQPDAKSSMTPFMSPLILEAYVPDMTDNNDAQAIRGRVTGVQQPALAISQELLGYMEEFARMVFPEEGVLHPVDIDEIFERQDRPSQRAILNSGSVTVGTGKNLVSSFMKREPYGKITDPRIISTYQAANKLTYSHYTYAVAEHLRKQPWYAFGKTPLEIAKRVAYVCQCAEVEVHNTDFSRFDGHVSNVLRACERIVAMRGFAKEHRPMLSEIMLSQYGVRAVTKFGLWYFTGYVRGSGSGETADANSQDNAFVGYVTLRRTKVGTRFNTPEEAYAKLGVYGGDDGVTADVSASLYIRTALEMGQVLECETIQRHSLGVSFLSRQFSPYVWDGALDSMCDLRRQLSKLHITVNLVNTVTPMEKLVEKLTGYYLSDSHTPIIGELAATLLPLVKPNEKKDELRLVASWWSQYNSPEQYPNEDVGDWMEQVTSKQIPEFDFQLFRAWLADVTLDPKKVLVAPLMEPQSTPVPGKKSVVINGNLVAAKLRCQWGGKCDDPTCTGEHECLFGVNCSKRNTCKYVHPGDFDPSYAVTKACSSPSSPTPSVISAKTVASDTVLAAIAATVNGSVVKSVTPSANSTGSSSSPATKPKNQPKRKSGAKAGARKGKKH